MCASDTRLSPPPSAAPLTTPRSWGHGKSSPVYHDSASIYAGLPNPFDAGRYHSLAVMEDDLPTDLVVTSFTSDGVIMGIRHRSLPVEGVQFHPSLLTPHGELLLRNFLDLGGVR